MSLEEALNRNSDLMEKQNEMLAKVLAKSDAGEAGKAPAKAAAKAPAKKAAKADEGAADGGDDVEDRVKTLRGELAKWLGEFKANESDPETADRKSKLGAAFKGLEVKNINEITTEDQIDRLEKWFAKAEAKGRFTPEPEDAGDDDDDMGV